MKKRIMLIGPTDCGKTTLANALDGTDRPLRRTQDIIYGPKTIDTPGAYIENTGITEPFFRISLPVGRGIGELKRYLFG
ncbi:EutP/PduV family microcompartment system protein [Paenibacillus sp. B1-33]|uniref:EutP/PduV family microcompartment system protein n=1 Tax=unclassified Paenibacillus TaxID=185978 RepID=UPI003D2D2513